MPEKLPPAMFLADSPGLDFLNSLATPQGEAVDWISNGDDFLAWLDQSGLVPKSVLTAMHRSATPGELDAVAGQAHALREWFRGFVNKHKGKPLKRAAIGELGPLNELLSHDEEFFQLAARVRDDGVPSSRTEIDLRMERHWRSPSSLLLPIARAIAEVIGTDDFSLVKACEGSACTLHFVDRTRSHARRWCAMSVCGNRAKQAAHRSRVRG
jgi:predicted RNA-binding Zn ribbon-like protein